MQALDILASATGTAVFTQTPEDCSQYFRYQVWRGPAAAVTCMLVLLQMHGQIEAAV